MPENNSIKIEENAPVRTNIKTLIVLVVTSFIAGGGFAALQLQINAKADIDELNSHIVTDTSWGRNMMRTGEESNNRIKNVEANLRALITALNHKFDLDIEYRSQDDFFLDDISRIKTKERKSQ